MSSRPPAGRIRQSATYWQRGFEAPALVYSPLDGCVPRRGVSPQLLVADFLRGFFRRKGGLFRGSLAAGNGVHFAAGDFVTGIAGHLPEEVGGSRRDQRNHQERWRKRACAQFALVTQPQSG